MSIQIRPPRRQIQDFQQLLRIPANMWARVYEGLLEHGNSALQPTDLTRIAAEVVGDDSATRLVTQLISLFGVVRKSGSSEESIVSAIRSGLETEGDHAIVSEDDSDHVFRVLIQMLKLQCVKRVSKSLELSYDYVNLMKHARIICDIRPVYSDDAKSVESGVISFTFRLHYDSCDGQHDVSVAMDMKDVLQLKEQCERAVVKAETARGVFQHPLYVAGEE